MNITPEIIAKHAGHACQKNNDTVDQCRLIPAESEHVHAKRHDIFKHGNYRRKTCEGHKQEKQGSPDTSACHVDKHIRDRDKNKPPF